MDGNSLKPMLIAHYSDPASGAEAWLVVDTFLHGVAGGGIRMDAGVSEDLMKNLAATMSVKLGIVHPPLGGAKCGIRYDSRAPDSKQVLNRVVRAFAPFLKTCWVTGSDLGTDWLEVVDACRKQAGIPHPQFALMKAFGKESDHAIEEGIARLTNGTLLPVDPAIDLAMSNAVTGWTVCASTEEALAAMGERLEGKRVAIQGFGAVGGSAAKFLAEAGATVVAVSDEFGSVIARNASGLDIDGLLRFRKPPARKVLIRELVRLKYDYEFAKGDPILYLPVDILIPAAGSHIHIDVDRVRSKLIVEGANDPFTEDEEESLHKRGITVIPDAIANSGSAGLYGLLVRGNVPLTKDAILDSLSDQARKMTRRVLEHVPDSPRRALREIALSEIRARIKEGYSVLPNGLTASDLRRMESEELQIQFRSTSPYAVTQISEIR